MLSRSKRTVAQAVRRRRFPKATANMKPLPLAWEEKKAVTGSSSEVELIAPGRPLRRPHLEVIRQDMRKKIRDLKCERRSSAVDRHPLGADRL
jgi:hypothetical protein